MYGLDVNPHHIVFSVSYQKYMCWSNASTYTILVLRHGQARSQPNLRHYDGFLHSLHCISMPAVIRKKCAAIILRCVHNECVEAMLSWALHVEILRLKVADCITYVRLGSVSPTLLHNCLYMYFPCSMSCVFVNEGVMAQELLYMSLCNSDEVNFF